jgi:hypothetical protein
MTGNPETACYNSHRDGRWHFREFIKKKEDLNEDKGKNKKKC